MGDTDEETARFREKACRGHHYDACAEWRSLAAKPGAPLDPLSEDRLVAEICLHQEDYRHVPLSVGRVSEPNEGCASNLFKPLAASKDPADRALLRALEHVPERVRAVDCVGRLYDVTACGLFALGNDDMWDAPRLPEEQAWEERMETLAYICDNPPPFEGDKHDVAIVCGDRKRIEKEYKAFIAKRAAKGTKP